MFFKTKKEAPKDEITKNAELLTRAGFIYKEMAGVYAYLPLGLRVLENIKRVVREEMNEIGAEECFMSSLQRKELWEKTDRWDDTNVDVWFKSALKNGTEVGFGWSHEEPITDMMREYISSYRDLPICVYQFQTKLRNELRAKSGIMRGREFVMKDMYSYTANAVAHQKFYDQTIDAYLRVFARVGLGKDTFMTCASGGAFTEFSHEFQTLTDAGEDVVYINREKNIAINKEVLTDETLASLGVSRDDLEEAKAAEVGNIFNFGTAKTEQLGLTYTNEAGQSVPVFLGSYGIGITRLMGVIVERYADEKGIVWPKEVAPFAVHLVSLCRETADITRADEVYQTLCNAGIAVLYDDRPDVRAGEKFADSDLIGIPLRVVVGAKGFADGMAEVTLRNDGTTTTCSISELPQHVAHI